MHHCRLHSGSLLSLKNEWTLEDWGFFCGPKISADLFRPFKVGCLWTLRPVALIVLGPSLLYPGLSPAFIWFLVI